jgi:hypothetical protein
MAENKQTNRGTDANRDPITGTPGAHPVGTGVGAAVGGAAAGAAVGSVAGPVGTVAGIIGGAVVGGLAGKGVAEAVDPTREDAYWREHHENQWFARDRSYDDYSGAYRAGYQGYDRHGRQGRTFEDSEAELRREYDTTPHASKLPWTEARDAARAAWHKVDGRWERMVDYEVQDEANNKIGTVHNLWVDDNGQPTFLGVKTGWIFGKNHVVPVHTASANDQQKIVRVPFTEQQIKDAPAFDANNDLSDADEQTIYSYYGISRPTTQRVGAQNTAETEELRLRRVMRTETANPTTGTATGTTQQQNVFSPLRRQNATESEIENKGETRFETESGKLRQTTPPYEPKERSRR